jgi:type I restriction enzyme S subunit
MSEHPLSWIGVTLGDLLRFNYGKSLPERARSGAGFPVYGSNGIVGYHDEPLTDGETLIIGRKGSVGEVHFSPGACFPIDTTYYVDQFHGMPTRYWFYQLKNIGLSELDKATAIPSLNRKDAYRVQVHLSPLNEQKRIADKLDALLARVDACRDRLDQIPRILENFRQAVLAAAISGELTKDWREYRDLTEWQSETLNEICLSITDGDHQAPPQVGHGIPFITIAAINDRHLNLDKATRFVPYSYFEQLKDSRKPEVGDILFSVTGSIAIPALVNTSEDFTFQRHIAILKPDSSRILSKFLFYSLCTEDVKRQAVAVATGTAQKTIPLSGLREFMIVLPPIDEQQEVIHRLDKLFTYADHIEVHYQKALRRLEQITSTLLSKAFRGELVSQDPDDEPASVLLERIKSEKRRMDSKRKTTRTVRSKTKEKPTSSMPKSLDDCVKALRSAFQQLGGQTDADKLFDQAGFQAEEVVQFYEALQATPEVRVAFEKSTQEYSVQTQSSIAKGGNDHPSQKGSFRLIELWLEDFKNLTDYTVRFDPSHSIDIVLGWNGTGKSNLFEALVIIFRDLYKWWEKNQWTENPMKGYILRYVMNEKIIEVSWQPGAMKRPKLKMGTLQAGKDEPEQLKSIARQKLLLPRFIFGYYSGPTNRLADHFLPMNQAHYNSLRDAKSDDTETLANLLEKRRFFCAENHHAKYVLLAFFHKEDPAISQFLEERLRIVGFESALFVIRKPRWAKSGNAAEFWGARGVMRRVMERLRRFAIAPMVVKQTVREGYRSRSEEHYYFFLPDLQSLHAFAAEYQDARTFFLALESIDFSELIYDLNIQVRVEATKTEQVAITFHELSEGEQQLLMVLGLMRFTKSHQSLVLLDEPDTHLNPHWSVDYLKLLTRVMSENSGESEEQQTSQILMSTHDPLVIASLLKEQIHLLKRDWQTGACKWDQPTVNPRGLGFTGILTSEMFGMRSDLDEETLADLDTKVRLVAKEDSLTPEEAIELEEVNKRLEDAGFQKAFSDPYYAAFIRAWSRRYSDLMSGTRFLSPDQREEVDQIAGEVLEEILAELQAEVAN